MSQNFRFSFNDWLVCKRIQEKLLEQNKQILIIEGNIGAGKSTFCKHLFLKKCNPDDYDHHYLHVEEGINERHLVKFSRKLKEFPYDNEKAIWRFENNITNKSHFLLKKAVKQTLCSEKYYIFDRSILGHYVFLLLYYFMGYIDEQIVINYERQYGISWKLKVMPFLYDNCIILHLFKYVENCFINKNKRGHDSDEFVTKHYLQLIEWCYYCVYNHFKLLVKRVVFGYPVDRWNLNDQTNKMPFNNIRQYLIIGRIKKRFKLYAFPEYYIALQYLKYCPVTLKQDRFLDEIPTTS